MYRARLCQWIGKRLEGFDLSVASWSQGRPSSILKTSCLCLCFKANWSDMTKAKRHLHAASFLFVDRFTSSSIWRFAALHGTAVLCAEVSKTFESPSSYDPNVLWAGHDSTMREDRKLLVAPNIKMYQNGQGVQTTSNFQSFANFESRVSQK